ncbi:MAG: dipeptidase PepE [Rubricoccaceae bacterium]
MHSTFCILVRLLLLSNSTSPGRSYLAHAVSWMGEFLTGATRVAFVPYAGVTVGWDAYADKVRDALAPLGIELVSTHEAASPVEALDSADAVLVGGGNTFNLLREMYTVGLVDAIRQRVHGGMPFVGWSAGSNVACPTIRTTNDMPIVEPPSFDALGFVPFQINPHYTDAHPDGHQGETRAQRLAEFVTANPDVPVIGLPEGTALRIDGHQLDLLGGDALRFDPSTPEGRPTSVEEIRELAAL